MNDNNFCIDENTCISNEELEKMKTTKKMTLKEFMSNCYAQGGNWAAMLMSGIRNLSEKNEDFKILYDSMLDDKTYSFNELIILLETLVDMEEK